MTSKTTQRKLTQPHGRNGASKADLARRRPADPLDALLRQAIDLAPDAKTRAWFEGIQGGQRVAGDGVAYSAAAEAKKSG
jgi:hypothetical protein